MWTKPAVAARNALPAKRRACITALIEATARDPFAPDTQRDTIKGKRDTFRRRVGSWRVLYAIDRKMRTLTVIDIRP